MSRSDQPAYSSCESLQKIPASRILKVLDFGAMMQIAYTMTREEREAVAKFLGQRAVNSFTAGSILQGSQGHDQRQLQVHLERLEPQGR